jgi:predicted PurR-regulated permease PerM
VPSLQVFQSGWRANWRCPRHILWAVQILDGRAARILATICVFVGAGALLYGIRRTLVLFLFAIFFAYLLEPLVTHIQHSPLARQSRALAIAETYLVVAGGLAVLFVFFGPQLEKDTRSLVQQLPTLLQNVTSGKIVWTLGQRHGWSYDTQLRFEHLISSHRQEILNWVARLGSEAAQFAANAIWVALVPILAVFFLADGRRFAEVLVDAVDRRDRRRLLRGIIGDLDQVLAGFILAQITLGAFSVVAYSVVLILLHFPYALALGLAGGFMEFIPVVGPLMAAGVILGVGFLSAFSPLWAVLIFLGVWRVCQDYVISPRIYGRGLRLHPLVAIAAVLAGGELGGILGVYLSIPIAAAVRVLWQRWQDFSDEQTPAPPETAANLTPMAPRKSVR